MKGRGGYDIRRRRRREIEALVQDIGAAETDEYPRYLVLWAQALPENADRMIRHPAKRLAAHAPPNHRRRSAGHHRRSQNHVATADSRWLGSALGLTYARRQRIGITTIGAIDVNKRQRTQLRKLRAHERYRRRRQALEQRPESNRFGAQAMGGEGISRRTWERRRRADANSNVAIARDANSNVALLLTSPRNCVNVQESTLGGRVMPTGRDNTAYLTMYREQDSMYSRRRPRLLGA